MFLFSPYVGKVILTSSPTLLLGFCLPRKDPERTIVHAYLPNAEFDALAALRGPRSWRNFFWAITDDARKAAEANQELREKVGFLEEQLRRERSG